MLSLRKDVHTRMRRYARQSANSRTASAHVTAYRDLLPADVVVVAAGNDASAGALYPVEEDTIRGAIEKRRHEYALGRTCARTALRHLGIAEQAIPTGSSREPVWPDGVVGSITHCAGLVAAAVARADRYLGIGLDAEPATRVLEQPLTRHICTPAEAERLPTLGLPAGLESMLVFSAKETVHKAIAPSSRVWLGFHDVEIDFDPAHSAYSARLIRAPHERLAPLSRLVGRYAVSDGFVLTAAVIGHAAGAG